MFCGKCAEMGEDPRDMSACAVCGLCRRVGVEYPLLCGGGRTPVGVSNGPFELHDCVVVG